MPETSLPQLGHCQDVLPIDEFGTKTQLLAALGRGSDPIAVMLACSELGYAAYHVSSANPGEIVVVQNAGGLIPPEHVKDAFFESLVEGLMSPTVRHLIVCGHTGCIALAFLIVEDESEQETQWREPLQCIRERFHANADYVDRPIQDQLSIVIQESVVRQLVNLRSHSYIRTRLNEEQLKLHGWVRDDQSSAIAAYNPAIGQFCS